ncbi:MAG: acetyl-CoA carboxylase biotin carboxylase subunit [Calditrichales bacterium]|nr:MAG: acetyl-CoA carboxylase biotin carboxylase subunit [Calditrichales bacterium]
MFKKILIANRGEIALRIARTCREMGIETVAVFSDLDRHSPFVHFCDEAYPLGGMTSLETYLRVDKILKICRASGAEAIHPGYGFLSENAAFARDVSNAGITFIGPPAEAIELMGNKTSARTKMIAAGVPVVPGTEHAIKSLVEAVATCRDIGFPVLIKAAAGGGGKGMRFVENQKDLANAIDAARREAAAAFGNSDVYIEKFVEEPRHIEFQILADAHGRTIHLGERECSIQRRHQKVIEEAPSVLLDTGLRTDMGAAAVKAAEACGYRNAGTIEFLVDKNRRFYFLEMNTRLQVEHPVTEMVTGLDLVKEQLLIADGQRMSLDKSVECFWGHAIECRIYAENPDDNFAPSPGVIQHISPPNGPGIRVDSGVTAGNEISLYYDPMISKLICWAPSRTDAIKKMIRALQEYELTGIHSTIPFLIKVLEHQRFATGNFTTRFISEESSLFDLDEQKGRIAAFAAAILYDLDKNKKRYQDVPEQSLSTWKQTKRRNLLSRP